jgi:hypothetical protein
MAKETIEVVINKDGTYDLDPKGFKGKACLRATADLEQALGGKDLKRTPKPEMNEKEIADKVTVGK